MTNIADRFSNARQQIFRLEVLPVYQVEEETIAYQRYRAGKSLAATPPPHREWIEFLSVKQREGVAVTRLRALSSPPTTYERWELGWAYTFNMAAGEQIWSISREQLLKQWDEPRDYWLFDDNLAALVTYDSDGRWLGLEDATAHLEPLLDVRRRLLAHAQRLEA